MIAAFVAYGSAIAALLAVAALAIERAFAAFALPRRGVWLVTIVATIGIPALMMLSPPVQTVASSQLAHDSAPIASAAMMAQQQATPSAVARHYATIQWPSLARFDSLLAALWFAMSALLACAYTLGWWRVRHTAMHGETIEIEGHAVIVTDDIGPAVFGFARPRVVVPRWVLQSPRAVRDLVLQHEFQHVTARDQWSLLLALIAVVIAPWNLVLWWQSRRLRLAIEIDCDARVVAHGADPISYGEVLLSVGRMHLATPSAAVALTKPRSDLERRIRAIVSAPPRRRTSIAIGCAALGVSMLAAAAQIEAPPGALRLPAPQSSKTNEIEAAVRREFPELFARPLAAPVLVEVLFNADMTIDAAQKRTLAPGTTWEAAVGDGEHGSSFSAARLQPNEPRRAGRIEIKETPASAPVYIAFTARGPAKSERNAALAETQRDMVRRYFPDTASGGENEHKLLWMLLDADGRVVQSGRTVYGPESFVGDLELHYPGARNAKRLVTPLSSLFGTPMLDTQGQPLLAAFIWLPEVAPLPGAPAELALEAKVYRNDSAVAVQRRAARFDEALSSHIQEDLRFDMTAIKVSDDEVEVRVRLQARTDRKDVEFADPWETVGTPTVRTRYDREAVIEQGIRYPDANKRPEVWRIVLTPHRS